MLGSWKALRHPSRRTKKKKKSIVGVMSKCLNEHTMVLVLVVKVWSEQGGKTQRRLLRDTKAMTMCGTRKDVDRYL